MRPRRRGGSRRPGDGRADLDRSGPRLAAWTLLLAVFLLNYVETAVEDRVHGRPVSELATRVAFAFSEIESAVHLDGVFAHHEASGPIAVYGYSISYFFLFPLLALGLAAALTLRPDGRHLGLLARALAIDYAVSLPLFVFFPIPERWAYKDPAPSSSRTAGPPASSRPCGR